MLPLHRPKLEPVRSHGGFFFLDTETDYTSGTHFGKCCFKASTENSDFPFPFNYLSREKRHAFDQSRSDAIKQFASEFSIWQQLQFKVFG